MARSRRIGSIRFSARLEIPQPEILLARAMAIARLEPQRLAMLRRLQSEKELPARCRREK